MTMPDERSRAVIMTREFLLSLMHGDIKRVPKEVKGRARSLLRHYPSKFYIDQAAKTSPSVFGETDEVPTNG